MKHRWVCALVALVTAGVWQAGAAEPGGKAAKRAMAEIRRHCPGPADCGA